MQIRQQNSPPSLGHGPFTAGGPAQARFCADSTQGRPGGTADRGRSGAVRGGGRRARRGSPTGLTPPAWPRRARPQAEEHAREPEGPAGGAPAAPPRGRPRRRAFLLACRRGGTRSPRQAGGRAGPGPRRAGDGGRGGGRPGGLQASTGAAARLGPRRAATAPFRARPRPPLRPGPPSRAPVGRAGAALRRVPSAAPAAPLTWLRGAAAPQTARRNRPPPPRPPPPPCCRRQTGAIERGRGLRAARKPRPRHAPACCVSRDPASYPEQSAAPPSAASSNPGMGGLLQAASISNCQ